MITLTLLDSQQKTPLRTWRFALKPVVRIGRAPNNDVVIPDILVSRYHLELHCQDLPRQNLPRQNLPQQRLNQWHLKSQGVNGTFLDGKLVTQGQLSHGSIVQLGPTGPILRFELKLANAPAAGTQSEVPAVTLDIALPLPALLTADSPQNLANCTHAGNFPGNLFCIHCGKPLNVQRTIRNYQVLRMLGHGGMGTTFLVCSQQTTPGERPELKVLKEMNADIEDIPKAQELFEREARILKSLCHAGIPQFYDYFVEDRRKYIVMELIHGQDLDKIVSQQGPLPLPQAITWMLQTCGVLDYLHRQEPPVIHRDLKPSNLLVRSRDNQVVVIDFGAVKEAGFSAGTRIAVEGYSAPEQSLGHPQVQSDVYGVGATLIFLLTGQGPIKYYRNRGGGYRFYLKDVAGIPDTLKDVITKATAPRPQDRYQTALELAQGLRACLPAGSLKSPPP